MATLDIPGGQPDLLRHVRRRRRGTWRRSAHRILHDPVTLLAAAILLAIFLAVLFAPYMTAYDPYVGSALRRLRPIGTPGHWLGTDEIGRDIYTRLLFGGRLSLLAGVTPVAFALLIGGSLGLVAGYGGGWVNTVIMRTMDMFYAFPSVLLAVAICSIVGAGLREYDHCTDNRVDFPYRKADGKPHDADTKSRFRAGGARQRRLNRLDPYPPCARQRARPDPRLWDKSRWSLYYIGLRLDLPRPRRAAAAEPEWGAMLKLVASGDLRRTYQCGAAGRHDLHYVAVLQSRQRRPSSRPRHPSDQ